MNIVIAGGSGGIGSAFVEALARRTPAGNIIATYHRRLPDTEHANVSWQQLDLTDAAAIQDWATAIGEVTEDIFHDNKKAWSGDHCIDSSLVPGVLFCNRKIDTENARLMDIGATVLDMFGVDIPKSMDAKPMAVADAEPDGGKNNAK